MRNFSKVKTYVFIYHLFRLEKDLNSKSSASPSFFILLPLQIKLKDKCEGREEIPFSWFVWWVRVLYSFYIMFVVSWELGGNKRGKEEEEIMEIEHLRDKHSKFKILLKLQKTDSRF